MHWNILDKKRISLLREIVKSVEIGEYYMAGGTALSLQLGLRKSVDFDFFVPHKFNPHSLYAQLKDICIDDITAVNVDNRGTCYGRYQRHSRHESACHRQSGGCQRFF